MSISETYLNSAKNLLNSPEGHKTVTIELVNSLEPKANHMLAVALRQSAEGANLLAEKPEITDAILKSAPDSATSIATALMGTPKGQEILRTNHDLVTEMLKSDNRNAIRKTIRPILHNKGPSDQIANTADIEKNSTQQQKV